LFLIYPELLWDVTSFRQEQSYRRRDDEMNRYYKCLDPDDRKYVKQVRDHYKKSVRDCYILDDRTAEECIAKVLFEMQDKATRVPTVMDSRIMECLENSKNTAMRRNKGNPYKYSIYNGLATTFLIQNGGDTYKTSKNEKIVVTSCHDNILWKDIVNMSAIYCAMNSNTFSLTGTQVTAEQVFKTICAGYYNDEMLKKFIDELNETVDRFNQIRGEYFEETKTVPREYPISEKDKFFFDCDTDEDGNAFNEDGVGTFRKSKYQDICERQSRIVPIDPKLVNCNDLDMSYTLSYLVYRHEFSRNMKHVISYNTMRRLLGKYPEGEFSYETMAFSVRKWLNELKPMFKGRKVGFDRVSWKEDKTE